VTDTSGPVIISILPTWSTAWLVSSYVTGALTSTVGGTKVNAPAGMLAACVVVTSVQVVVGTWRYKSETVATPLSASLVDQPTLIGLGQGTETAQR